MSQTRAAVSVKRLYLIIGLLVVAFGVAFASMPHAPALEDTAVFQLTVHGCTGRYTYVARGLPDGSADFEARGATFQQRGHLTRAQWRRFLEGLQWALDEARNTPSPMPTTVYAPGFFYSVRLDTVEGRRSQEALDDPTATVLLRFLDSSVAMEPFHNPVAPLEAR